ncbi:GNAT family N-acetyltransferase [Corynebacterium pilosum]|uniref:Acetyltransferase n=1 Tax=Corynebacterium pilosum TaxID=35756 RepID=A0A376CRY0_9CORY|nr:GNAT family N-acetyltransferase [Corynebacterium pilosum]STC70388.1 acetyltransferase [Corynebacterium pilosum]
MATTTRTDRLILIPLTVEEATEAFKVYSDPRIWRHRPGQVHTEKETTRQLIERTHQSWTKHNLGPWAAYLRERPSEFIGVGGVEVYNDDVYDIKYRLRPDHWGNGFATEITEAAIRMAKRTNPDMPITARITTNHPASGRIVEKLGLSTIWEGRRAGTEDDPSEPDVRIYADRELSDDVLNTLKARP